MRKPTRRYGVLRHTCGAELKKDADNMGIWTCTNRKCRAVVDIGEVGDREASRLNYDRASGGFARQRAVA